MEEYQVRVRDKLSELIGRERELIAGETYKPNPGANCRFCDFKSLCPLWPEGRPVFRRSGAMTAEIPARGRRRHGRRAHRGAVGGHLAPARALRARRRRRLRQDLGDGGARGVPRAGGARARRRTRGVLPGNVLCLTFTNKATENLQLRVRRALANLELDEGEEPEIQNYHGFAAALLERHGMLAGVEPGQRILTTAQRTELCGRVLDLMTFDHVKTEWQPSVVANILELYDQAQNHLVSPARIVAYAEERLTALAEHRSDRAYKAALDRIELAQAAEVFEDLKRQLGVIDFGDQIALALRVVEPHPEVADEYRARFEAVLLDEYQDTNVAQAKLMHSVFGGGHPVTAVGDPDQNIYAWRGASLYNLLDFPETFRRADGSAAPKLPLYTNFRSGARILGAADTLIAPLPAAQRPDPEKALRPQPAQRRGPVVVARHPDEMTEARWIAPSRAPARRGRQWAEIAVLCRTSRLFFLLQQAFEEREVPVEILGLAGLLKVPVIVEVLAYARAVQDPLASRRARPHPDGTAVPGRLQGPGGRRLAREAGIPAAAR